MLKIGTDDVTAYFGDTQVTARLIAPGAGTITGIRHYSQDGASVAKRNGNQPIRYLFDDVQGSATLAVDAGAPASASVSRQRYTPYGNTRGYANQLNIERGWLGQIEDDTTGLTYLNARYYDPAVARFISPDPLLNPTNPQTLNPYTYARNNPTTLTDPTGLEPGSFCNTPDCTQHDNDMRAGKAKPCAMTCYSNKGYEVPKVMFENTKGDGGKGGKIRNFVGGLVNGAFEVAQASSGLLFARRDTTWGSWYHNEFDRMQEFYNGLIGADQSSNAFGLGSGAVEWGSLVFGAASAIGKGAGVFGRLGGRAPATAPKVIPRLQQDIAVNPRPPAAMNPFGRSIGRPSHNQALQDELNSLPSGVTDVRVNQQQVNAAGQRVGINRPDLQYTHNGQRYYVEWEGPKNPRGEAHRERILANDPTAKVDVRLKP